MKNKKVETQAYNNPSYDKSLTIKQRLIDFLGAYHVVLNGVHAHDPYIKHKDDGGGMCCQDSKESLVKFVELLAADTRSQALDAAVGIAKNHLYHNTPNTYEQACTNVEIEDLITELNKLKGE